ncbi:MAG: hypothetical protein H7326_00430 [Bdellovibrionaceae bacterium]|nr:hypothetical protein [Pseudobdellovibrionaceae bacterium]
MNSKPMQDFLNYLKEPSDLEYGDFKRRTDAHLRHLVEWQWNIDAHQAKALTKIREDLIWTDHGDDQIESMKKKLGQEVLSILGPTQS